MRGDPYVSVGGWLVNRDHMQTARIEPMTGVGWHWIIDLSGGQTWRGEPFATRDECRRDLARVLGIAVVDL